MRRLSATLAIAATLALGACAFGTNFELDSLTRIKPGMTEPEVIAVMGDVPTAVGVNGNHKVLSWVYGSAFSGGKSARLVLVDGKIPDDYVAPVIAKR